MKELFVSYEIALKLKELGFDEFCLGLYYIENKQWFLNSDERPVDNEYFIYAPLYQQVIDWLKIEKKILVIERWDGWEFGSYEWDAFIYSKTKDAAINEAIKLISK